MKCVTKFLNRLNFSKNRFRPKFIIIEYLRSNFFFFFKYYLPSKLGSSNGKGKKKKCKKYTPTPSHPIR
ncbi:hypothetical protein PGB90_007004 [Kerria lacca]